MAVSENGVYRQPSPWEGKTHENPWELQGVQVFPTFSDKTHMVSRCFTMFQWVAGSSFQAWMTPLDLSGPSGFGVRSPGWPEPDGLSRTDPWTGPAWPFVPRNFGVDGGKICVRYRDFMRFDIYFCWTDLLFLYFIFGGWALRVTFGHKTKLSGDCVQLVFWFSLSFRIALFYTQGCISKNGFGIWLFILNFSQVCWSVLTYNAIYRAAIRIFQILPTAQVVAKSQKSWN